MVAGNKSDRQNERQINAEDAEAYCKSIGAEHIDTSAKSGLGVEELFYNCTHSNFTTTTLV